MWTFYYLRSSVNGDLRALWLVQDLMSAQMLLSLLAQSLTLLVRGQTAVADFPWPHRLPEALFYVSALAVCLVHACVLGLREMYRIDHFGSDDTSPTTSVQNHHTYVRLDYVVWIAMFVLPSLGVLVGVLVNADDKHHYRRYLQFLRLEFDTRLGMHSPR
jgi:hypothetical protein